MGAKSCKEDRCAACCVHDNSKSLDIIALKPSDAAPGLDTLKAAPVTTPAAPPPKTGSMFETYEDGSTYDGQIVDGQRHGRGVWKSKLEAYEGEWLLDTRHGHGKQNWDDGRHYDGQFRDGKFHGTGRMEWTTPEGKMGYDGEYCDDVKHGHGKYSWPDGRIYDGQWADGTRSGKATLINPRGSRRQGIWKDDKLQKWIDDGDANA